LLITGGLIGLPGQTREDILGDISLTRSLQAEMYSFGPFIPHPGTPLANSHSPAAVEVLKALAVARIADARNAKIVVTTSFETLEKDARRQGLSAGANSVMISLTPDALRREYTLYPDRAHLNESLENQISDLLNILSDLGRAPTDIGVSHAAS
ncbi:MAG: [FeFe] hydrogenase H-cluster radical SAM maturase HydE, partial [bacterium]|nr:[FeFe] hydrogenase H-cluster radical SAM maturase HydE [bacterium]